MVGRRLAASILLLVAAAPAGAGTPTDFHAQLSLADGLQAAGAVAPLEGATSFFADGRLAEGAGPETPVMTARQVHVEIRTRAVETPFELGSRPLPLPRDPVNDRSEEFEALNVTLELLSGDAYAQYRIQDWAWPAKGPAASTTAGADCTLHEPAHGTQHPFPDDPRGVPSPANLAEVDGTLVARCQVASAAFVRPAFASFYGVEVQLRADGQDRTIRTGQFDEPGPAGTTRRVVQTLHLTFRQPDLAFDFPQPHDLEVHADAFAVAGTVSSPAAHGNVAWRGEERNGDLASFAAEGAFVAAMGQPGHARLDGQALSVAGFSTGLATTTRDAIATAAIAAGSLLAAALALRLVSWLFTRVTPERLLEHPRRAALLDCIRAEPGATVQDMARILGMHWGVAAYHVAALRRGGQVHLARVGGRTALFPRTSGHAPRSAEAWLRRPSHARVHAELVARPGAGPTQVASRLGMTQARVSQILADMAQAGLVEARPQGRRRGYWPRPVVPVSAQA